MYGIPRSTYSLTEIERCIPWLIGVGVQNLLNIVRYVSVMYMYVDRDREIY